MKKRILSMFLAVLMIVTALPAMTVFSFAGEQATSVEVTYNDLYVRQENLLAQADFFDAEKSTERVTTLKDYIVRGNVLNSDGSVKNYAYSVNTGYPAVYLDNGYLNLTYGDNLPNSSGVLATRGGNISFNTDLDIADGAEGVMTYQYVTAGDEFSGTIGQALSSTAGRINLATDGTYVYPSGMMSVIKNDNAATRYPSTTFTKDNFGTLPKIGESFTVTQTLNVTSEGEEGNVYLNLTPQAYSQSFEDGDKLYRYTGIGTGADANDTMRIYALRVYNVILTDDEIAHNNLIDVAKFYSIDIERVQYILSLDDELKREILENVFEIKLTRTKSKEAAAAELEKIIAKSVNVLYNTMYAKYDDLYLQMDFFDAEADSENKLTSDELRSFVIKGQTSGVSVISNYPEVYLGDGCLRMLSTEGKGGNVSFGANNENYEVNRNLSYQFIISADSFNGGKNATDNEIGQTTGVSAGRITLRYDATTKKVYPYNIMMCVYLDKVTYDKTITNGVAAQATEAPRAYPGNQFAQSSFSTLSGLGESMTLTQTAVITSPDNAPLSTFCGGSLSGYVYLNGDKSAYGTSFDNVNATLTQTIKTTGADDKKVTLNYTGNAQMTAYSSTGTGVNHDDEMSMYAFRLYHTVIDEADIAHNNFIDIAKFYSFDINEVRKILSLEDGIKAVIFDKLYSLKLTRTKTNAEAKAEFDAIVEESLKEYYYESNYVTDGLVFDINFFDATPDDVLAPTKANGTLGSDYLGASSSFEKFIKTNEYIDANSRPAYTANVTGGVATHPDSFQFTDFYINWRQGSFPSQSVKVLRTELALALEYDGIADVTFTEKTDSKGVLTSSVATWTENGEAKTATSAAVYSFSAADVVAGYQNVLSLYGKTGYTVVDDTAISNSIIVKDAGGNTVYTKTKSASASKYTLAVFSRLTTVTQEQMLETKGWKGIITNNLWAKVSQTSQFRYGNICLGNNSILNFNNIYYGNNSTVNLRTGKEYTLDMLTFHNGQYGESTMYTGVTRAQYGLNANAKYYTFTKPTGQMTAGAFTRYNGTLSGTKVITTIPTGASENLVYTFKSQNVLSSASGTDGMTMNVFVNGIHAFEFVGTYSGSSDGLNLNENKNISLYSYRIYNRVITEDEIAKNHLADMYTFYDVSALDYATLDNEGRAFVDSKVANWTLDTFTEKGTAPENSPEIKAQAQAELDKYIDWTKIDYSAYDEMPARYKQYIKTAIEAISYDDYAEYADPAAQAQTDINTLVDAYQFDLSEYNKLPASYKLKIDALVAEFDIDAITSADDVKAAAQAAFDNAIKEAVNDYNSLYVNDGLIAHFDAKTYVKEYDKATDAYIDLAGARIDFNADLSYVEGENYIAGSQIAYFSAISATDGKIVAPYTLEALVSPTKNSAFVDSGLSSFLSYNSTDEQFKLRNNLSTWRFSYSNGAIGAQMWRELGTAFTGIGSNALKPGDVLTFTHRLDEITVSTVSSENKTYPFFDANDIFYHSEMKNAEWDDDTETGSKKYLAGYYYHPTTKALDKIQGDDGVALAHPTDVQFDGYLKYSIFTDANRISGDGAATDAYTGGTSFVYPTSNGALIRIGNSGGDADFRIYDVRLYNRALTNDEVKQNHTVDLFKYYEIDMYDYVRLDDTQKKAVADVIGAYSVSEITAEELQQLLKTAAINASDYSVKSGLVAYFDAEQYILKYGTPKATGTADKLGKSIVWYLNKLPTYDENGRYVLGMFYYDSILDDTARDGVQPYAGHTVDMLVRPTATGNDVITTGFDKLNIVAVGETLKLRHDYSSWRLDGGMPYVNMFANTNLSVYDGEGTALPSDEVFNFTIRTQTTELEATSLEIPTKYPSGTQYSSNLSTVLAYGPYNETYYRTYDAYKTAAGDAAKAEEEVKLYMGEIEAYKYDGYYHSEFIANGYTFQNKNFSFVYRPEATVNATQSGYNAGTRVMVGGSNLEVYRVRVYNRALTDAEMAQNHFADLVYYYGIDAVGFDKLPEATRLNIVNLFSDVKFDNEFSAEELQEKYDEIAYPEQNGESLAGTEGVVVFNGYQTRLASYPGIRANFSYDADQIAALESEGYSIELGVVMAIANEGRTVEDLAVIYNGEKYIAAGNQMIASPVYKNGEAVGSILNLDSTNPEFVYTITYKNASSQTSDMYTLDCMYRAYLIAEKDGISYITYYNCDNISFGDAISAYELASVYMYDRNLDNSVVKGVISVAGYNDEVNELYELYAQAQAKIDEKGIKSLSFDELNLLYNIMIKAEKDDLLALRLKYYESAKKATDVDGDIDICKSIDAMIDSYSNAHGVDIRDSLYEITGATGTVYFDVTTDKDPNTYVYGDSITFNVNLRDKTTKNLVSCSAVSYSYTIDGVSGTKSGTASAPAGSFSFTIPSSEIKASALADNVNETSQGILVRVKATAQGVSIQEAFEGGAVVDMANIKASAAKPADYDTFWAAQLAAIKDIKPTDTTVTAYTGDGVVISDIKRADGDNNVGVYSATAGKTISEDNYFHIVPITKERLALLQAKGLHTGTASSRLDSYDVYEVYLKSAGPTPSVGILSIPKTLTASTGIVLSFAGYSAHAPSISAWGSNIQFGVSHSGYWADATDAELYNSLNGSGILGAYGKAISGRANSGYEDATDNYILYMFLRNLQAVRFITELPESTDAITDTSLKAIYDALLKVKGLGGGKVTLSGSSMGGYQTIGTTALAEQFGIDILNATPTIPAFCNLAGNAVGGRLNDIFSIEYEENMNYFEPAFFAEYITADVTIGRCGLGDYTCPPSGIIATYNALKSKKSITFYQNSTHGYSIDEDIYKFTVTADAQN